MSHQRAIRFPDEVDRAIQAKALDLDRPYSWVVVNCVRTALVQGFGPVRGQGAVDQANSLTRASSSAKAGVRPIPKGRP